MLPTCGRAKGSTVDGRVAELHEALLRAKVVCEDREAAIKVAITVFIAAWHRLAQDDARGQQLAERVNFSADADWQAVEEFDEAVSDGALPSTDPDVLMQQWKGVVVPREGDEAAEEDGASQNTAVRLKRRLQKDNAILRLHRRLTADLAGISAANERDSLQVGARGVRGGSIYSCFHYF